MGELVRLVVVRNVPEGEMVRALLADAGIESLLRVTDVGAGAMDGLATGGPQEVLVRADDVERAREVLDAPVQERLGPGDA
jgi:hypothetical protein